MKLLLVEDDHIIWPNIKEYLEENNFLVTLKDNWEDWYKEAKRNKYDLFLFDVMLPYKSGFEIAKELRKEWINTPIIFLTAKEDLESIEKGFLSGWDDYLVKPFKLKELILRIRAILKRTQNTTTINTIKIWDIELNLDLKEVYRNWKKIELTPKEFLILEYLMKNKNKVIPKKELLEYIWWINNDIRSDVVRSHIQTLRAKINKGFNYDPIKTIRGIWFKFEDNEK
jgi:two-component system copper resistance phosphate regulon response regulator CusR